MHCTFQKYFLLSCNTRYKLLYSYDIHYLSSIQETESLPNCLFWLGFALGVTHWTKDRIIARNCGSINEDFYIRLCRELVCYLTRFISHTVYCWGISMHIHGGFIACCRISANWVLKPCESFLHTRGWALPPVQILAKWVFKCIVVIKVVKCLLYSVRLQFHF